jgi:hypothetical protein
MAEPAGRFCVGFGHDTLEWSITWTRIDDPELYPNLVTSYTIDRGRQYELDRTDTGRATVTIADRNGVLDPPNPDGPFFGQLEPLLPAALARWDPVRDAWYTRFRGFIEDFTYTFEPTQNVNRLQVTLVDMFEILSAIKMNPVPTGDTPAFGDDPAVVAPDSPGQVVFANEAMQDRIEGVLGNALIPPEFYVVFTGNVEVATAVYSPGESPMTVVQEATDAEFPGVSNTFVDRLGRLRLCVHGRLAKFDPAGVLAGIDDPTVWDWHVWDVGDGAYVNGASGSRAQIRRFAFNRGLSKIINSALATPMWRIDTGGGLQVKPDDDELAANTVTDTLSISSYGYRSWEAQNLLTLRGILDDSDALTETQRFATYYVGNYSQPRDRITDIAFQSMRPTDERAPKLWELLSEIDISDQVNVTVLAPGGGGFDGTIPTGQFYVEGIHEQVNPLNANYDDVTLSLDLSPKAFFTDNPFPTS